MMGSNDKPANTESVGTTESDKTDLAKPVETVSDNLGKRVWI